MMDTEVIVSIIAGFFSVGAVIVSIYMARVVEGLRTELETQKASAYKKLWSLTAPLTPTGKGLLPPVERDALEKRMNEWYYENGNGIFLSSKSQKKFLAARKLLRSEVMPQADDTGKEADADADFDRAIRGAFSILRTQLKADLKVYQGFARFRKLG